MVGKYESMYLLVVHPTYLRQLYDEKFEKFKSQIVVS